MPPLRRGCSYIRGADSLLLGAGLRGGTHRDLGNRILADLGLSDAPQSLAFRKAITAPDGWGEEDPHHYGRGEDIRRLILEARSLHLRGDEKGCMRSLGYALHYVQDHWTHTPGRGKPHHAYERNVDEAPLVETAPVDGLPAESRGTIAEVEALLGSNEAGREATLRLASRIPGAGNPTLDKHYAYRVSRRITENVLLDEAPSLRERERGIREEARREEEKLDAEPKSKDYAQGSLLTRILRLPAYILALIQARRVEGERSRIRRRCSREIRGLYEPHHGWYAPEEPVDI